MTMFNASKIAYKNGYNTGVKDTIDKLKELFTNSLYVDTYVNLNSLSNLIEEIQNELSIHA